jgi:hypothetical protein
VAVAGNIKAMKKALEQSGGVSIETILNVHKALLGETAPEIVRNILYEAPEASRLMDVFASELARRQ